MKSAEYEFPAFLIGIWRIQSHPPQTDTLFTSGKNKGYTFDLTGEKTDPKDGYCHGLKYGIDCVDGDVIEMILDLTQLTLSFKINDIDYGVAYENIIKDKYRLGVWLYKKDSVSIIG